MVAATSLEREREEQRRWRLRPDYAELQVFDRLLVNEFHALEIGIARGNSD